MGISDALITNLLQMVTIACQHHEHMIPCVRIFLFFLMCTDDTELRAYIEI